MVIHKAGAVARLSMEQEANGLAATVDREWRYQRLLRHGRNSFSGCLLYDQVRYFHSQECDGFIGYVAANGVLVSYGEPVCSAADYGLAAREFVGFCRKQGKSCIFAAVGEDFLKATASLAWTKAVVGEDMIFDLARYAPRGDRAKKVRSARNQAIKRGASVSEYCQFAGRDPFLEKQITRVCERWLKSLPRHQMHFLDLDLFKLAELKRYFYAVFEGKVVGILSCLPIYGRNGYLLEDLVRDPEAPNGITELLVLEAIHTFKEEGKEIATMGLSPKVELHREWGFSWWQVGLVRLGVKVADKASGLQGLYHYRKKFHTGHVETIYLVKHPIGIGFRDLLGIMKAFNI